MKIIKLKCEERIPKEYTGIIEWDDGDKIWLKNGIYHREDGPAVIYKKGYMSWYLDGKFLLSSYGNLWLTNQILLSKEKHPEYPIVQVWKILDKDKVYEQFIIPGMEEFIKE